MMIEFRCNENWHFCVMISGARNAENKELKIYELQHELVQHLPLFKVKDESLFLFILYSFAGFSHYL